MSTSRARVLSNYVSSGDELALKAPLASPTFTGTTTVSGDLVPSTPLSHRNMVINGAMQVWQRATGATTTGSPSYFTVDRWKMYESTDGSYTSEKHTMSLAELNTTGHASALKLTPTVADPDIEASQYAYITQFIEAQNCQHLQYGTANAKTITLSFWVKSNVTGTWCIHLRKPDNTAYNYIKNYSISSADTWEHKTITITPTAGSTSLITGANGAINNDNGVGLIVGFNLGWGSNGHGADDTWNSSDDYGTSSHSTTASFMANTSNTFYLTGVQLELGSNATPFEHRSYGDELARCYRYCERFVGSPVDTGSGSSGAECFFGMGLIQDAATNHNTFMKYYPKRTAPSVTINNIKCGNAASWWNTITSVGSGGLGLTSGRVRFGSSTTNGSAYATFVCAALNNDTDSWIQFDAEL